MMTANARLAPTDAQRAFRVFSTPHLRTSAPPLQRVFRGFLGGSFLNMCYQQRADVSARKRGRAIREEMGVETPLNTRGLMEACHAS
jgi:hypothetical protein